MRWRSIFPFLVAGTLLSEMSVRELRAEESPARQHLEITGNHTLRFIYDCTFTWPSGGGYEAVLRLPVPPDTGNQQISHFSSSLPGKIALLDGDVPAHKVLMATLHHQSGNERRVDWRIEVTGQFQTRQLTDGPPAPGTVITPPAPGDFLASTDSIDWQTDSFQSWLDDAGLRRHPGEAAVDYGSRVFAYFQAHGRYVYPPETAWNAAAACHHLRTDCGGFSLVFVAACRANHIPARLLAGNWFKTREASDGTLDIIKRQSHVIAEFFDPQIGWIPEDISSTLMRIPGPNGLNYFGCDPGYFLAWHVDTDFRFDTPQKPDAKVQWIQNPSPWFSEDADGVYDSLSHHWTLQTLK